MNRSAFPFSHSSSYFHFFPPFYEANVNSGSSGHQGLGLCYCIRRRQGTGVAEGANTGGGRVRTLHTPPAPPRALPEPLTAPSRGTGQATRVPWAWDLCCQRAASSRGWGLELPTAQARRGVTFITVTWCFLAKIIANNACVFAVPTVVAPDLLLEAVGQGPLAPGALHVVQVDGSSPFPKVGHGSCPGGAPGSRAV